MEGEEEGEWERGEEGNEGKEGREDEGGWRQKGRNKVDSKKGQVTHALSKVSVYKSVQGFASVEFIGWAWQYKYISGSGRGKQHYCQQAYKSPWQHKCRYYVS